MAIKAIINNIEKEIEQIKNSDEQDIDYVYSRIGDTEVEGEPPISIKSIGGELTDYRIYGNTVDGESVGDRTVNLFDGIEPFSNANTDTKMQLDIWFRFHQASDSSQSVAAASAAINAQIGQHIIRTITPKEGYERLVVKHNGLSKDIIFISKILEVEKTYTISFDITKNDVQTVRGMIISNIQIEENSQATDYEPYGYRVPVTVSNGTDTLTTPIYLPEQIKKVGDEVEYIDYGEQKQHRVRKNLLQNTAKDREIDVTFTVNSDGSVTCNGTASATVSSDRISLSLPAGSYYLNGTPSGGSLSTYHMFVWYYNDEFEFIWYNDIGDGVSFTIDNSYDVNVGIEIISGYTCNNLTFYPMIRKADIEDDTYEPYIENTDLDVTLPALPTLTGTNVLSVETTIQPSNIYIKDNFDYKRVFTATRAIEDELPLNYKSIEDSDSTLKNYRIYGNTVGGESVGDLVESGEHAGEYKVPVTVEGKNLWDGELTDAYHLSDTTGLPVSFARRFATLQPITINQSEYCLTYNSTTDLRFMYSVFNNDTLIRRVATVNNRYLQSGDAIDTAGGNKIYFAFYNNDYSLATTKMISNIMLNAGSTPLPYEPYHAPVTTLIYLPEPLKMVGDEAEYIDYAEQKQHVDADEEIEKQAATYMVSITPQTDVSKIVFVTMSSVSDDCTILTSGLIFTLDEADANTLNSTNYADGVRGKASTAHNYRYTWTKKYTEGETYYIRSYVKYQTADNEIKEVYGNVYKADINGFERVRKNLLPINAELDVTLPALPTLTGTNVLSVETEVQPSEVYIKGKIKEIN